MSSCLSTETLSARIEGVNAEEEEEDGDEAVSKHSSFLGMSEANGGNSEDSQFAANGSGGMYFANHQLQQHHVKTVDLMGVPIVALVLEGQERLCLAQISNTLLKSFSYNEIHNRRVALGITCVQCTPVQLEILRRAGAMPVSSRRCGMITKREAERLCKSFLTDNEPLKLPEDFCFSVNHSCAWGCKGDFMPSRYNSSRAKCIKCYYCGSFYSPNKFIFHSHKSASAEYVQPDAANFNSWRRHLMLADGNAEDEDIMHAWEDVKAMFNGGCRKRIGQNILKASRPNKSPQATVIGSPTTKIGFHRSLLANHSSSITNRHQKQLSSSSSSSSLSVAGASTAPNPSSSRKKCNDSSSSSSGSLKRLKSELTDHSAIAEQHHTEEAATHVIAHTAKMHLTPTLEWPATVPYPFCPPNIAAPAFSPASTHLGATVSTAFPPVGSIFWPPPLPFSLFRAAAANSHVMSLMAADCQSAEKPLLGPSNSHGHYAKMSPSASGIAVDNGHVERQQSNRSFVTSSSSGSDSSVAQPDASNGSFMSAFAPFSGPMFSATEPSTSSNFHGFNMMARATNKHKNQLRAKSSRKQSSSSSGVKYVSHDRSQHGGLAPIAGTSYKDASTNYFHNRKVPEELQTLLLNEIQARKKLEQDLMHLKGALLHKNGTPSPRSSPAVD